MIRLLAFLVVVAIAGLIYWRAKYEATHYTGGPSGKRSGLFR